MIGIGAVWAEGNRLVAGGNSFEASLFPQAAQFPEVTLARAGPLKDKVLAVYGGDPKGAAQDLTTENTVIEPNRHLARLHTRNGQKAWVYYFSYLPAAQRGQVKGLAHGGEIIYVFNNLRDAPESIQELLQKRGGASIVLCEAGIPPLRRAETLTLEEWAMLVNAIG